MQRLLMMVGILALGQTSQAHDYASFEELGAAFGYDLEKQVDPLVVQG